VPLRLARETQPLSSFASLISLALLCCIVFSFASEANASEGLNLAPSPIPLAINFITLLILIYPVKRWLLQPLVRVLIEREQRTLGAEVRSSELRDNAGSLAEQVETRLREARLAAQQARAEIVATGESHERQLLEQARSEAAQRVAAIRATLAEELDAARTQLEAQGQALANVAASQLLGRSL